MPVTPLSNRGQVISFFGVGFVSRVHKGTYSFFRQKVLKNLYKRTDKTDRIGFLILVS